MTDTTWATTFSAGDSPSTSRVNINANFAAARRLTVVTITNADSPYTAGESDVILADATGGAITVNLLSAPDVVVGDAYRIVKIDGSGNAVTLDGDGSETINGATTRALSSQWAGVTIVRTSATTWVELK